MHAPSKAKKPVCRLCGQPPKGKTWKADWEANHLARWCPEVFRRNQEAINTAAGENIDQSSNTVPVASDDMFIASQYGDTGERNTDEVFSTFEGSGRMESYLEENDTTNHPVEEAISSFSEPQFYLTRSRALANTASSRSSRNTVTEDHAFSAILPPEDLPPNPPALHPLQMSSLFELLQQRTVTEDIPNSQSARFAVQQFLAKNPQISSNATNELLQLIKFLTSEHNLLYSRQLPVTSDALWKEVEKDDTTFVDSRDLLETIQNFTAFQERYNLSPAEIVGLQVANVTISEGFTVQLPYFDILATVLDILSQHTEDRIGKQVLHFNPVTTYHGTQRMNQNILYKDLVSGMWWKEMDHFLQNTVYQGQLQSIKPCVLAVLPYLDGVSVDFFDSISMLPLVITVGNLDRDYRNYLSGKRLLAFIPNPSDMEIRVKTTNRKGDVSHYRQVILNKCLEIIFSPLKRAQEMGGLAFSMPNESANTVYYPAIPFFVGDNKELNHLAAVRSGGMTNRQCRICLKESAHMNEFRHLNDGEMLRRRSVVVEACNSGRVSRLQTLKDLSVSEDIGDSFLFNNHQLFGLPGREHAFYESFPPDNLHTLYAGVIKYSVCWSLDILKALKGMTALYRLDEIFIKRFRTGSSLDGEFEFIVPRKALSNIVKHTKVGSKAQSGNKFSRNVTEQAGGRKLSGDKKRIRRNDPPHQPISKSEKYSSKFRSLSWGAVLVGLTLTLGCSKEDELLPTNHPTCGMIRDIVVRGLFSVMNLMFELTSTEYMSSAIDNLENVIIPRTLTHMYEIYLIRGELLSKTNDFRGIKLHIVTHIPHLIRRFGAPINWDTDTFESSHKVFVVSQWESGAKRTQELEVDTMKSYRFWCEVCQLCGVQSNGKWKASYSICEKNVQQEVRRWRHDTELPNEESVIYKFTQKGYKLNFREHSNENPLTIRSQFTLTKTHVSSTKSEPSTVEYTPHPLVKTNLLELLQQLSTLYHGQLLSYAFQSKDNICLANLQIFLHEHMTIQGKGPLEGYNNFNVYATNKYGNKKNKRSRYDYVEITIPTASGGVIAGSSDLMRVSEDIALAQVLGIVTLRYFEREMCLLFVQFLRKELPPRQKDLGKHIRKYLSRAENIFYGKPASNWLALYPIITLKGPALYVPDPFHDSYGHVISTRFVCRGGWWQEEPNENDEPDIEEPTFLLLHNRIMRQREAQDRGHVLRTFSQSDDGIEQEEEEEEEEEEELSAADAFSLHSSASSDNEN